jgi:hypothetical protein
MFARYQASAVVLDFATEEARSNFQAGRAAALSI